MTQVNRLVVTIMAACMATSKAIMFTKTNKTFTVGYDVFAFYT